MSCGDDIDGNTLHALESGVATVIAAAAALPERESLTLEIGTVESAAARGYFLPDEEEWVRPFAKSPFV